jgi:hypothetical protein
MGQEPAPHPQCCGLCQRWAPASQEIGGGYRECRWPRPSVPFWAQIEGAAYHDGFTRATDGRRCPTFASRED